MNKPIPRLVIAGVHSNVGKTTLMISLIQILKDRGLKVKSFKCGPDYLDPTYHKNVSGSDSINLDSWMMGKDGVLKTFNECTKGYDIALIEGVMGLFDGADPKNDEGSTAEIAKILDAPVALIIDASGMARSAAAIFHGFKNFDKLLNLKGVILNSLGSSRHLEIIEEALGKEFSFGGVTKGDESFMFESRKLGLKTAMGENVSKEMLEYWRDHCLKYLNIDKLLHVSQVEGVTNILRTPKINKEQNIKIAYALDEAFHFYYPENLNSLRDLGATLIPFSPIKDEHIPTGTDFIYIGGGYPELYARELNENISMVSSIRNFASQGGPIFGECGGLIYLSSELELENNKTYQMLNLLNLNIKVTPKLKSLGYTTIELLKESFLGEAGDTLRGHQFRYSDYKENQEHKEMRLIKKRGSVISNEGFRNKNVLGTYVHSHFASNPNVAQNIINWILDRK